MTLSQQIFNLVIGTASIVLVISLIAGFAFWLGDKLNKDDKH